MANPLDTNNFAPVNPSAIGGDIARYNLAAVAGDPRLGNIMRNLRGQVPSDLRRNLAQAAAERGVAIGAPGSANSETNFLRSLGLTTYDLMNRGGEQYAQLLSGVPKLNPESTFISPSEQVANRLKLQMQENDIQAALQRLRESEAGATGRAREGFSASAANQARDLAFKGSALDAERQRAASGAAATARAIDAILNRNTSIWGGNGLDAGFMSQSNNWGGASAGDDFFGYLDNLDPNAIGNPQQPQESAIDYGGFERDFGLDTGSTGTTTFGAPEGYTFENFGTPSEDYGASEAADFEYAWDTLSGNF